jgi:hypothetical protein
MTTDEILARVPGIKRQEHKGWTCFCCVHPDGQKQGRASLRLLEDARTGWRHFKCFAGCPEYTILAAVGLTPADLAPQSPQERRIVAIYDYTDGVGTLRYQVVRYVPKDFRMRRPDGRGGWIYSLTGVERVLYRLPDLAEQPRVLLVEGEGLVEELRLLKLP